MAETDAPPPEASPRAAWTADSNKPKLDSVEGAQTTIEISLKGVKKPLGIIPIGGDASLTHLRDAIKGNIEQQYLPPRFAFVGQAGQVRGTREPYFPVASFNGKIQIMPKAVRQRKTKDGSWLDETLSKSVLMTDSQYGETLDYGSVQLKSAWDDFPTRKKLYKPSH